MQKILIKYTIFHTLMVLCLILATALFSELLDTEMEIVNGEGSFYLIFICLAFPWLLYISSRLFGYALYNIRISWLKAEQDAKK